MSAPQRGGVGFSGDPKSKERGERDVHSIVLREFGGVNQRSPREAIGDNEFAWLEELIPVANGNLRLISSAAARVASLPQEHGEPSFTLAVNIAGVDYVFAIWSNTGDAWLLPIDGSAAMSVTTGVFTSGQTAATQWGNQGVLIVDPVEGLLDWNLTVPNVMTHLSGQLYDPEVSTTNLAQLSLGVGGLRIVDTGGTGSGGQIGASYSAYSVAVTAAGTGYVPGDRLQAVGGTLTTSVHAPITQQSQPLVITVTSVGGAGDITGISITNVGYYQNPPGNPVAVTAGGSGGAGATFTASWQNGSPFLVAPGAHYTAPKVEAFIGGVWVDYSMTVKTSGTLLGTAIAVYAGRAWVAINRTVQFTDVDSYSSFANSGSSFTINDSYLHDNITALFAANNYLYIFGDDSIDLLSNVTVVGGIANFSRINVTSSIGTTHPESIFAYSRTIAFANNAGFYVLSGATPEKVSDNLDNVIAAVDFTKKVYGGQVMVYNVLCAAFLFTFSDSITLRPAQPRSILAVQIKGRWWFTSQLSPGGTQMGAFVSLPVAGLSSLYGWSGTSLYPLFAGTNVANWLLKTKLWDMGVPMLDKSAILAGMGAVLGDAPSPGVDVYVDSEMSSVLTTVAQEFPQVAWVDNAGDPVQWINDSGDIVQWVIVPQGYSLYLGQANNGGGKFIGLTATGNDNLVEVRLLALEIEATRRW